MYETNERDCHTISMASSNLSWEDVDKKVRNSPFRNRSQYIQYLIEKDFERYRYFIDNLVPITLLVMMILILIVVIIK